MKYQLIVCAGLPALTSPTAAQEGLKQEPGRGVLRHGEKVLVESRKCPRGQVMEITGRMPGRGTRNTHAPSTPRERRCVPRLTKSHSSGAPDTIRTRGRPSLDRKSRIAERAVTEAQEYICRRVGWRGRYLRNAF